MKARVRKGRRVLDEATALPEGTEVDLASDPVPADRCDDLDDENFRKREDALDRAECDVQQGRVIRTDTVLDRLRRKA